jgi:hypothetical protein
MSRRLILAFLIAPLMTPLVFIVTVFSRNAPAASLKGICLIFLLYTPFAYLAEGLIGIPAFLLFRFFNWNGFVVYCCGGALIALLAMFLISKLFITWSVPGGDFAWCMVAGAISALAFRLIVGDAVVDPKPVRIRGEI